MSLEEHKFIQSLNKAYRTVKNFTSIADEELAFQLPDFEEMESEEQCIQVMSLAYQKITETLQKEQNELLDEEEKNCKEIEKLKIYNNELYKKLNMMKDHLSEIDKKIEKRTNSGAMISFQRQEGDFVSLEDIENLKSQIEEQDQLNKRITEMELENEIREDIGKRVDSLEEELNYLQNEKFELKSEMKNLVKSSRQFEQYQNVTQEQKKYLKVDFRKLVRKNENNFEKYQELMEIKSALDDEVASLDEKMEKVRSENKIMGMNTKDVKMLQKGLDEQQSINNLLQDKLENLERKSSELGIQLRPRESIVNIDLTSQGRDYELADEFKVEIFNEKVDYEQEIMKNYDIIEHLEEKAEELSQELIRETAIQERMIQEELISGNKENVSFVDRISQNSDQNFEFKLREDDLVSYKSDFKKKLKSLD